MDLITPEQASIARATTAGWLVAMIVLRRGWLEIVSCFVVGQLSSYYWTVQIVMLLGLMMSWYEPVAFGIGAVGMFLWTAVFTVGNNFSKDPLGTFASILRTIRGQQGGSEQ